MLSIIQDLTLSTVNMRSSTASPMDTLFMLARQYLEAGDSQEFLMSLELNLANYTQDLENIAET